MQGVFSWIESQDLAPVSCLQGARINLFSTTGKFYPESQTDYCGCPRGWQLAKDAGITQQDGPETAPLLSDPAPYWNWL